MRTIEITPPQATGGALALLAASNVVSNIWLTRYAYVPWNLGVASTLVAIARTSGLDATDLGGDPRRFRSSVRIGAVGTGIVAATYGCLLLTGTGARALDDGRATSLSRHEMLWHLFVRIPFGTVFAEEVAFRGVIPALLGSSSRRNLSPDLISSLLFGLWHWLPSRELPKANAAVARIASNRNPGRVPVAAVVATSAAGFVLQTLRRRTNHLGAPVLVHLAVNTIGFALARAMGGRR